MLRRTVLTFLVILLWTTGSFAAEWEYIYEGNKLPDDSALGGKVWKVFKTPGINSSDVAKITPAGELHITDPNDKVCFFMRDHNKLTQTTLEARVKVLSQSGAMYTVTLEIEDGVDTTYLGLFPDHIELVGGTIHAVDMTQYRILRLVRRNNNVDIYMDGKKVIEGKVGGDTSDRHSITFGAGSTGGAAEHYWDYVAYTTAGAFTPGELPDYFSIAQAVEASGKLPVRWAELKVR